MQPEHDRKNPLEDDIVAFRFVNKKLLKEDAGLFRTKWFDYRMLTPMQATRLYIEAFGDVYREYFAREFSRKNAPFIKTPEVENLMERLEQAEEKARVTFSGMWRGRQVADAIGMPYKEYIHTAMGCRLRFWKQKHLPQAHQLYAKADVEKVVDRWEEMQGSRLYTSDDPAYLVQNYGEFDHQNDYHEWLIKQAMLRGNPWYVLAQFVNQRQMPMNKIESRFDPDHVERVQRHIH